MKSGGKFLQQRLIQANACLKIRDGEILIGRVSLAVWQRESEQQRVRIQDVFESLYDRDAATFTDERHLPAKGSLQRTLSSLTMR